MSSVDRHLARVTVAMAILLSTQTQGISQTAADAPQASERPALVSHVMPVYPQIAQTAKVSGIVIIEATVGVDGRITNARVLRSVPLLDQAALEAVRQWEYLPTTLNGVPVPVIMSVTVTFKLSDR